MRANEDDDNNDNDDDDEDEETRDSPEPQRAELLGGRDMLEAKWRRRRAADGKGDKNYPLGFSI